MTFPSPKYFGIPHDEWRPNQLSLFKLVKDSIDNKRNDIIFGEMGTGSGKTAVATAMGHKENVLVAVHSLGLLDQYRDKYGFEIIKGRQEYPCVLEEKIRGWQKIMGTGGVPTAADCHFAPMTKCPEAGSCPYILQKNRAVYAKRAACTYRYLGVSRLMKERPGHLVFDEAHDAAEELIRFNEFSIKHEIIIKFRLPIFPFPYYGDNNKGAILSDAHQENVLTWLETCVNLLIVSDEEAETGIGSEKRKLYTKLTRFMGSVSKTQWFLSLPKEKILFQALSAAQIVQDIFSQKNTKLLMSATIGSPEPLADIMGIENYKTFTFPHPVPPRFRTVKKLDVDRMTQFNLKTDPSLFTKQAMEIYYWIEKMPSSWRGIILTTSYFKIGKLGDYFTKKYTGKRKLLIQKPGEKLNALIAEFIDDVNYGDIAIGTIQGWGTGLDLSGELARWMVIAGVPHTNPTDEYMKARREVEGGANYQRWTTYNAVMQACGRVSRGEKDYAGHIPNYAAIADGSALTKTAKKYYNKSFKESLI